MGSAQKFKCCGSPQPTQPCPICYKMNHQNLPQHATVETNQKGPRPPEDSKFLFCVICLWSLALQSPPAIPKAPDVLGSAPSCLHVSLGSALFCGAPPPRHNSDFGSDPADPRGWTKRTLPMCCLFNSLLQNLTVSSLRN